jgi:hypothetical protein
MVSAGSLFVTDDSATVVATEMSRGPWARSRRRPSRPRPIMYDDCAGEISAGSARLGILEPGLTDYIVLQIPVGDMTLAEAKRTMDIFCSDVKPALEKGL